MTVSAPFIPLHNLQIASGIERVCYFKITNLQTGLSSAHEVVPELLGSPRNPVA